jgi:ribosome-binding factor A
VPDRDVLSPDARGNTREGDLPTPEQAGAALDAARPRLQKLLAGRVKLRNTPVLRFQQDPVRQTADRVEELLRDVRRNQD